MTRIAVARLWFEANSFAPGVTAKAAFAGREWSSGAAALAAGRGTATELGGLAAFLDARPDWQAVLLRCASAQPGAPLQDALLAAWLDEVTRGLAAARPDGVYLSLHGACASLSDPTADLTILRRIRQTIGPRIPLTASFDCHANLGAEAATLLDGASIYRSYPHTDMDATARRALRLLERALSGAPRLAGHIAKRPMVLHSFHMGSAGGPMADSWAEAAALETGRVHDASLLGGFAWGDSPDAGAGAMAWAEDAALARDTAEHLADALAARRARFTTRLPGPAEALALALAAPPGLVALLDPADNPLSGGIADTPGLLATLLEAAPAVPAVFAYLHDPETVAAAQAVGVGGLLRRSLCGRRSPAFGPPIRVEAVVERLTDGRFVNHGPMERGRTTELGPSCVLRVRDLAIIVTSRKEAAIDPGFFTLHGIDLPRTRLLANKAKNHFLAAFGSRCSAIISCDAPGPAALDLTTLPFRHVPLEWRR